MDLSVNTMQEFEFILSVFARFLALQPKRSTSFHLLLIFKDDTMIEQATDIIKTCSVSSLNL